MLRISESIRHNGTQDGAILLDIQHGQMFSMNATAARILELVRRGCDESQIVAEISQVYGGNEDIVRADIVELIERLITLQILKSSVVPDKLDQQRRAR